MAVAVIGVSHDALVARLELAGNFNELVIALLGRSE